MLYAVLKCKQKTEKRRILIDGQNMPDSIYSWTDKIRYSTDNVRCPSAILSSGTSVTDFLVKQKDLEFFSFCQVVRCKKPAENMKFHSMVSNTLALKQLFSKKL